MTDRLALDLLPELAEIGRLTGEVEAFCERLAFPVAAIYQITLVLDELVTNVISHGIAPGETLPITVSLRHDDGVLTIELSDPGRPFDPRTVPPPNAEAPLEEREIGGLGVHFARTMVDSIDYRYADSRNHLTLVKRIQKEAQ